MNIGGYCLFCGKKLYVRDGQCWNCGNRMGKWVFPVGFYAVSASAAPFNPLKIYTAEELERAVRDNEVAIGSIVEREDGLLAKICWQMGYKKLYMQEVGWSAESISPLPKTKLLMISAAVKIMVGDE